MQIIKKRDVAEKKKRQTDRQTEGGTLRGRLQEYEETKADRGGESNRVRGEDKTKKKISTFFLDVLTNLMI